MSYNNPAVDLRDFIQETANPTLLGTVRSIEYDFDADVVRVHFKNTLTRELENRLDGIKLFQKNAKIVDDNLVLEYPIDTDFTRSLEFYTPDIIQKSNIVDDYQSERFYLKSSRIEVKFESGLDTLAEAFTLKEVLVGYYGEDRVLLVQVDVPKLTATYIVR